MSFPELPASSQLLLVSPVAAYATLPAVLPDTMRTLVAATRAGKAGALWFPLHTSRIWRMVLLG